MSRNEREFYRPPPQRPRDNAEYTHQLERELALATAQLRSLEAEVRRLQCHVPRAVLKGECRLTRQEKMERSRPSPCL